MSQWGKCLVCGINNAARPDPQGKPDWFVEKYPPQYCNRCWESGRALAWLAEEINKDLAALPPLPPFQSGVSWWGKYQQEQDIIREEVMSNTAAAPAKTTEKREEDPLSLFFGGKEG